MWDVERDGKKYRVEMEDEYFFGRRVVRVDGVVAYSGRTVLSDHSGAYQFDLGGRPAFLKISTNGFTYSYDLVTDVPNISTPRRSTAGPVSLTQRAPTIGAIVALLAFGLGALVAIDLTADGRAWREPAVALLGTPANARVIGAGTTSRDARRIRYRFEVGGHSFTHEGYVSRERYDLARASGMVPIVTWLRSLISTPSMPTCRIYFSRMRWCSCSSGERVRCSSTPHGRGCGTIWCGSDSKSQVKRPKVVLRKSETFAAAT